MSLTGDLTEVGIKYLFGLIENLKATGKLVIKDAFLVLSLIHISEPTRPY